MSDSHGKVFENRLANETSPYLLQHRHNPVDWFPWGEEAFEKAKAEDRPIFLSVGYSACHWCHVMERESFENEAIAAVMNEHFINIKVDREERPDVDNLYMAAVQAMTQHGGWPMSVFLTPDAKPFFGGTYFPPSDGRGMPGFPRVLLSVAEAWKTRRDDIEASAGELTEMIRGLGRETGSNSGDLDFKLLDGAFRALSNAFDPANGGFGDAPKFPHPMDLKVLLRHHSRTGEVAALNMVKVTLDKMARGGIYDHLGGGFARYSTDDRWLVPHFEKMLYDNALLTSVYIEAFQQTRDPEYARVARETIEYVLERMTGPEGGFYSTEDADSEGVEGKYYVWSRSEIRSLLGEERAETFCLVYDVSDRGNWEHQNILNLPRPIAEVAARMRVRELDLRRDLAADLEILLDARERRIPPGKDTKILTSWNGLMIAALADAAHALGEPRYAFEAAKSADFLLKTMRAADGRLLHAYKDGRARYNGYLDDYANLIDGLTRLFEATGEAKWIAAAVELSEILIAEFSDRENGGFFYIGANHEPLIARQRDAMDNATPSGNAMAATALLRLAALTGKAAILEAGLGALRSVRGIMERYPTAAGQSLVALDFHLASTKEFALVSGADPGEFQEGLRLIAARFLPQKVVAPAIGEPAPATSRLVPLLENRGSRDGRLTTYICENFACREPVIGVDGLEAALKGA